MANTPERRDLQFNSLDEAVADATNLAGGATRTTGKHSFGQILEHLALTHDMATGKITPPRPPLIMRLVMPVMKHIILNGPVKPGFKLPQDAESFFWPAGDVDVQQALTHLRESVENYKSNGPLAKHPIFGTLSREKVDFLNCSHCAMHLSFVHPT
ncbi:hypothetical protein Poly51_30840 [Rubripirellula tenax]|uniref:DUF1569 domain-containing protein n=1 Tax=Rubripirellula tenax TaxID=2528015 RepID=A0A5C6F1V7_9BACT|nr:DUF1569 domain-containing protein [Rubripirellula tenax]TWU54367.1 hypothetical protein Poly51_30840 [Rubripirellula tenax]